MTSGRECELVGKWRIVEADLWDTDYLDLVEPAHITFHDDGSGEFAFGAVNGGLDCAYGQRTIFFTWAGFDEMDEVNGAGSAELDDDDTLSLEICFHLGDEAEFKARRW